jgi:hypothetical protein
MTSRSDFFWKLVSDSGFLCELVSNSGFLCELAVISDFLLELVSDSGFLCELVSEQWNQGTVVMLVNAETVVVCLPVYYSVSRCGEYLHTGVEATDSGTILKGVNHGSSYGRNDVHNVISRGGFADVPAGEGSEV